MRPLLELAPSNADTVRVAREVLAGAMRMLGPPLSGTTVTPVDDHGARGEWVYARRLGALDAVILYVHGGGYVACSPRTHRGITSRLSAATGMKVFAVGYRLAPEHPFPAAVHDVAAAYRWLLGQGFTPDRIVLAGDSAGGQLAADLVLANARAATPQPAALVLFSPMVDLTLTIAARHERTRRDPLISVPKVRSLVEMYTGGSAHPRLELRPEQGMVLPRMLIQVGDAEFVAADAVELARRWHAVGAESELQMWPDQLHVFHALPVLAPEASSAYRAAARFISASLESDTAHAV
ncbi:hypothetical protein GCM10023318_50280 [Nocardia callitridis]|uniref:Alpha/beta hydrolase fold-3 domain-containing protein n=1 Tax=Nocardia callitridis TaxID=648753 RepID=A0ABP9KUE8_9NOCA